MEEPVAQVVTFEENGRPRARGGPLGRRWKLVASVNLFILSLKSKWRRSQRVKLAGLPGDGDVGAIYESDPRCLVNNWMGSQAVPCTSSMFPSPGSSAAGSNTGLNLADICRPGAAGSLDLLSRRLTSFVGIYNNNDRRMSVKNVWQNLTKGRSESPERRGSNFGVVDARDGHHWPTSVTRQLAFGPWETAASRSKLHGYLMKVPFAKLITLVVFLICVIVVAVIYAKEAEVEEKLKQKFGWI